MKPYRITTIADTAFRETEVTLIGPGLATAGQRYAFSARPPAEAFVDSLNFAFVQGVKEGLELATLGARSPGNRDGETLGERG